jgi:hypothetical protein
VQILWQFVAELAGRLNGALQLRQLRLVKPHQSGSRGRLKQDVVVGGHLSSSPHRSHLAIAGKCIMRACDRHGDLGALTFGNHRSTGEPITDRINAMTGLRRWLGVQ